MNKFTALEGNKIKLSKYWNGVEAYAKMRGGRIDMENYISWSYLAPASFNLNSCNNITVLAYHIIIN